jgi:signal transduction histidine kinase
MNRLLRLSAARLAWLYVGASLLGLAVFAASLSYAWSHTIGSARDALLANDVARLVAIYEHDGLGMLRQAIELDVDRRYGERDYLMILLADNGYRPIAGNLPRWPQEVSETDGVSHTTLAAKGQQVSTTVLVRRLAGGYHLLMARDVQRFEVLQTKFLAGLVGAAVVLSAVGLSAGLLMRRSVLAEVQSINQATHEIVQGKLAHRLPARTGAGELGALVDTVNRMLDQIEQLVEGVRSVSNAIAHDLRTPLSELRSHLEELIVTRPPPEQVWVGIDDAIVDVDRVIAIFNALLRMAELDTGVRRAGFVDVDAGAVAIEAGEFYQPVAELQGVTLQCEAYGPLPLLGDPLLLAQALGNLIDNALKYGAQGGRVQLHALRRRDGRIELGVADAGSGISDNEKTRVLERFYRGDSSRGTPGAGLGLSLVAAIARLHGGSLELTDNGPGLKVVLVLPSMNVHV